MRNKNWSNTVKTPKLIAKCKRYGCSKELGMISLGKRNDGKYFVYTHRAMSSAFAKPESIPVSQIKFIASTS